MYSRIDNTIDNVNNINFTETFQDSINMLLDNNEIKSEIEIQDEVVAGSFNVSQELDDNNDNVTIINDSSKVEKNVDMFLHTKAKNCSEKVAAQKNNA